jgi:uncharacterized protein (DUF305 family)
MVTTPQDGVPRGMSARRLVETGIGLAAELMRDLPRGLSMILTYFMHGVRLVTLLLMALVTTACSSGSPAAGNPFGPSGMGGASAGGGGGQMAGMGMGMGMTMVRSEFDYLAHMIPHHVEAIDTATLLKQGTNRPEMRTFADTIIRTQSAEVAQMTAWLAAWYPGRDTRVDYAPMMRELRGLQGDALDRAFLEDMIPHHMMAVMMSQQLVTSGLSVHPGVVPFAIDIRDTQQQEIRMMRVWLGDWFGVAPHMGPGGM